MRAALIYPHPLFAEHPALRDAETCVLDRHRDFFAGNPRMSVMVTQCGRMGSRLDEHRRTAAEFLARLHGDR